MRVERSSWIPRLAPGWILVAAAAGCAGAGSQVRPTSADLSPASLYPLGRGYAWSYDVETGDGAPVLAIARVTGYGGGVAVVSTGPGAEQRYAVSATEIARVGQAGLLLKAPIAPGATWESGPGVQAQVTGTKVRLATPAGTFNDCVVVEERNPGSGQHVSTTYCPGVGPALVVSRMQVRGQALQVTARLRGYSLEPSE